jgi:hypothetical protein
VVKLTAELDDNKLRLTSAEQKPCVIEIHNVPSPYDSKIKQQAIDENNFDLLMLPINPNEFLDDGYINFESKSGDKTQQIIPEAENIEIKPFQEEQKKDVNEQQPVTVEPNKKEEESSEMGVTLLEG